jgi:hypothetical protein
MGPFAPLATPPFRRAVAAVAPRRQLSASPGIAPVSVAPAQLSSREVTALFLLRGSPSLAVVAGAERRSGGPAGERHRGSPRPGRRDCRGLPRSQRPPRGPGRGPRKPPTAKPPPPSSSAKSPLCSVVRVAAMGSCGSSGDGWVGGQLPQVWVGTARPQLAAALLREARPLWRGPRASWPLPAWYLRAKWYLFGIYALA